jgi:hypothetical protein
MVKVKLSRELNFQRSVIETVQSHAITTNSIFVVGVNDFSIDFVVFTFKSRDI